MSKNYSLPEDAVIRGSYYWLRLPLALQGDLVDALRERAAVLRRDIEDLEQHELGWFETQALADFRIREAVLTNLADRIEQAE